MKEQIIVRSEHINRKRMLKCFCAIGLILFFVLACLLSVGTMQQYMDYYNEATNPEGFYRTNFSSAFDAGIHGVLWNPDGIVTGVIIGGGICIIGLILFFALDCELVVTRNSVYGKAAFGRRVDLPMDSISAISSMWPEGIAVATSSGRITFLMIKNRDIIHKCISELIVARQNTSVATSAVSVKHKVPMSNADELKKYKELLDMGAITQEEFDAKKKQLLDL